MVILLYNCVFINVQSKNHLIDLLNPTHRLPHHQLQSQDARHHFIPHLILKLLESQSICLDVCATIH